MMTGHTSTRIPSRHSPGFNQELYFTWPLPVTLLRVQYYDRRLTQPGVRAFKIIVILEEKLRMYYYYTNENAQMKMIIKSFIV